MDAVLTVLVEEKIGPGEQARYLIQIAKEEFHFDYSLVLRSPVTALFLALSLFKSGGAEQKEPQNNEEEATESERNPLRKDGVLISALSPCYYLNVIRDAGMIPVVCDVEANSGSVCVASIESALEKAAGELNVCCMVLHESLGYLPDIQAISELGIPIIEDCSSAYGSVLSGKKAGTFGALTILGLEERDLLTAGGGALLFATERRNAAVLRNLPELPPEYALPDMNAVMALVQCREAARNAVKRNEIAAIYTEAAMRGRHKRFIQAEDFEYNNYAFPLILETGMKDIAAYAKKQDITVESAFSGTLIGAGLIPAQTCPVAYSLSLRTALFPIYPRLSPANASKVAKLIQTLP